MTKKAPEPLTPEKWWIGVASTALTLLSAGLSVRQLIRQRPKSLKITK